MSEEVQEDGISGIAVVVAAAAVVATLFLVDRLSGGFISRAVGVVVQACRGAPTVPPSLPPWVAWHERVRGFVEEEEIQQLGWLDSPLAENESEGALDIWREQKLNLEGIGQLPNPQIRRLEEAFVDVHIFYLEGCRPPADADADIAFANSEVFSQASITVRKVDETELDLGDVELDSAVLEAYTTPLEPTDHEQALLAAVSNQLEDGAIPVIYVGRLSRNGETMSDWGESFPPHTHPPNGLTTAVIVASIAPPKVLAHELAHVLLDTGEHADDDEGMSEAEKFRNLQTKDTKIVQAPFQYCLTDNQVAALRQSALLV